MNEIRRIRISAATNGSSQVRNFATSKRLTSALYNGERTYYSKDVEALQSGKNELPISDDVSSLIADILKINGVISVVLRTYDLVIEIALAFDWEDVQEDVLGSFYENLFPGVGVDLQDKTVSAPTTVPCFNRGL